ncbi:MAG: hypothetical protein II238_03030, partial [Alphaproteobacteria bacterium]|nr:hypothetical protein [Alphaproteobacteria bacterium]
SDGGAEEDSRVRKHHELCSDVETSRITGAETSWWSIVVSPRRCVARTCMSGYYLSVKNGASQGTCIDSCKDYQIVEWDLGGLACDTAKQKPKQREPVHKLHINDSACKSQELGPADMPTSNLKEGDSFNDLRRKVNFKHTCADKSGNSEYVYLDKTTNTWVPAFRSYCWCGVAVGTCINNSASGCVDEKFDIDEYWECKIIDKNCDEACEDECRKKYNAWVQ